MNYSKSTIWVIFFGKVLFLSGQGWAVTYIKTQSNFKKLYYLCRATCWLYKKHHSTGILLLAHVWCWFQVNLPFSCNARHINNWTTKKISNNCYSTSIFRGWLDTICNMMHTKYEHWVCNIFFYMQFKKKNKSKKYPFVVWPYLTLQQVTQNCSVMLYIQLTLGSTCLLCKISPVLLSCNKFRPR